MATKGNQNARGNKGGQTGRANAERMLDGPVPSRSFVVAKLRAILTPPQWANYKQYCVDHTERMWGHRHVMDEGRKRGG